MAAEIAAQASTSCCKLQQAFAGPDITPTFYARQGTDGASEYAPVPVEAQPSNVPASVQAQQPEVKFVDVGCGFGGLLVKLAPLYPDTLMLGMELRDKVWRRCKDSHCLPSQSLLMGSPCLYAGLLVLGMVLQAKYGMCMCLGYLRLTMAKHCIGVSAYQHSVLGRTIFWWLSSHEVISEALCRSRSM